MGKMLAIGDIHAKIWIIEKVAKVIHDYDNVIFCGDYADDFSASPQDTINTCNKLKDLQTENQSKVQLVIGNHDYIYVNDTPSLQSGYNHITQVLINAPENKNLKAWLAGLPVIIEVDGVTYSHAGITNEWSNLKNVNSLWNDMSPIWARPWGNITYKIRLKYLVTPLVILLVRLSKECGVSTHSLPCQMIPLLVMDRCCKLLMAKNSLCYT